MVFLPSHSETFANAVNEALILGRPVVTTYAGGIPEFSLYYNNCFSYDYRSPDIAAELIEYVLDNHPKFINRPKIPYCYSWKNTMEILDDTIAKYI